MVAVAGPILFNKEESPKKVFRQFSALGKQMRNHAKLFGNPYRLVISFEDQSYWVEVGKAGTLLDKDRLDQQEKDKKENPEEAQSDFSMDSKFFKKVQKLNKQFQFVQVETTASDQPISEGEAFFYISQDGLFDTGILQIKNVKTNAVWSITFNPLTAAATIIESPKTLKDLER